MRITIPDSKWYRTKSIESDSPLSCPYANVHKCPRFYASIFMLGKVKMITSMSKEKVKELDAFWSKSGLDPVIAEDDTGISGCAGSCSSFSNFCPEVTFSYLNYYATFLARYVDEIDKELGEKIALRENIPNDWRYEWATVSPCHYLDCNVYAQVKNHNSVGIGKFDNLAHSNIVTLISRMELCLDKNDPSGVLHAAANILETLAKDIVNNDNVQDQTLGGFITLYENESKLPNDIKAVVLQIYKLRNSMPLSGHGSTKSPDISLHDAIVISATVKFIVEIEYRSKKI